jgi:hypothetical protein
VSRYLILILIGASLVVGCTQSRSHEAFCRTLAEEKQHYRNKYSERQDEIVDRVDEGDLSSLSAALGTSFEAIRDMAVIFDKLEKAAPEEIRPDVETLRDALERQRDALKDLANNPLGALAGSLTSGPVTMGSWERVALYTKQHCGTQL